MDRSDKWSGRPLLFLGAAFPVEMMRGRIALDGDVFHGLRT
jgi:hypothetical protein